VPDIEKRHLLVLHFEFQYETTSLVKRNCGVEVRNVKHDIVDAQNVYLANVHILIPSANDKSHYPSIGLGWIG
jgi:hypothetical protein